MTISDPILSDIVDGFSAGGLSVPIARAIHHIALLLLAARSLDDVSVFATARQRDDGRFVVPAVGKWGISFVMSDFGPDDLRLEKLAKSWPQKNSRSSGRRSREKS